jgi:hypothetical protein
LAKNQIVAYIQLSTIWGITGKRKECHDYATRGLAELAQIRRSGIPIHESKVFPPDMLDQEEQQLRRCLEY